MMMKILKFKKNKDSLKIFLGAVCLLPVFTFLSCTQENSRPLSALENRGKSVYMGNCIACHNQDPRLIGSVGPDVAGSSLELLSARVIHQSYPPGHKPKRATGLMPALPFLKADLPALHAYLNSFSKK
ncbi:MAG: cytochrome c [Bacteriovorax sp.]|nr:cytochrome c [Bacteriovorax sp.]